MQANHYAMVRAWTNRPMMSDWLHNSDNQKDISEASLQVTADLLLNKYYLTRLWLTDFIPNRWHLMDGYVWSRRQHKVTSRIPTNRRSLTGAIRPYRKQDSVHTRPQVDNGKWRDIADVIWMPRRYNADSGKWIQVIKATLRLFWASPLNAPTDISTRKKHSGILDTDIHRSQKVPDVFKPE